jgi:hypothetical protein
MLAKASLGAAIKLEYTICETLIKMCHFEGRLKIWGRIHKTSYVQEFGSVKLT